MSVDGSPRPAPDERRRSILDGVPGPAIATVVGITYLALAQYVIWLNDPVNAGAGYWPAAGVTLAALLLLPRRRWGWVVGAVVAAEVGGSSLHGYPLVACTWWAAANAIEPVVAATLLRRLRHGERLSPMPDLVWFLAAGVVIGPLAGAAVGSVGTSAEFGNSWLEVFVKWWVGDGLGVLVVAPLLLAFREPRGPRRTQVEAVALAAAVVAVPLLAFRSWSPDWDVVLPYLLFPLLMWASVRFGIRGAAIAGFAVAELANIVTALGYGPFQLAAGADEHTVTVLQVFLGSALTAGLVIATLVTDALDRTRLYERQRSVADALQLAVLPERLPRVPGIELAARYAPASNDATIHVGGDWYDAFALSSGSTALAVGDVAGHDLPAAVVMAQLRNGLRSLLLESEDPAQALASLDRQLAMTDGPLATAICATVRAGELLWSNAGHPPLLLVGVDGSIRYLHEDPSPMLGTGRGAYYTHATQLEPGDVVVGITDGLVEHRSWSLDDAFAHLVHLVETAPSREPEALCDLLLAAGLDGRRREDDACILVMRRSLTPAIEERGGVAVGGGAAAWSAADDR